MKKIVLSLVLFIACSSYAQEIKGTKNKTVVSDNPVVHIAEGDLRGITEGDVSIFKGIPYAAPPVGKYRWRPPQAVKQWEGIRDASQFCSECAQAGFRRGSDSIAEGSSENCLFLNIWSPDGTTKSTKLPVMVWIHGGAFKFGSGSQPGFSGEQFAKQGIILVTINYRLGRLGFFAFPALSKEHPDEPKGNYAYMDQIAALKWVQKNIASFGGNPNNVTIFGQSAGGVSVHSLLTIPSARGLFQKAIIESGGGRDGVLSGRPIHKDGSDVYYPVSAETIGVNFARMYGIKGTGDDALAKLRALSVSEIVDGGKETDGRGGPRIYAGPILDGKLVVESFENAYKVGKQANVPLLIGSNSAEVPAGFVNADSKEELFSKFGKLKDEAKAAYDPEGTVSLAKLLTMVNTNVVWAEPARFTANSFVAKGEPVYMYRFSYVPRSMQERLRYGAPHGSEIPYVFDNLRDSRWMTVMAKDKEVARMIHDYWINFAKTGNPNGRSLPKWPKYNPKTNEIMEFRRNGKAIAEPDTNKARLDVVEKAVTSGIKLLTRGI